MFCWLQHHATICSSWIFLVLGKKYPQDRVFLRAIEHRVCLFMYTGGILSLEIFRCQPTLDFPCIQVELTVMDMDRIKKDIKAIQNLMEVGGFSTQWWLIHRIGVETYIWNMQLSSHIATVCAPAPPLRPTVCWRHGRSSWRSCPSTMYRLLKSRKSLRQTGLRIKHTGFSAWLIQPQFPLGIDIFPTFPLENAVEKTTALSLSSLVPYRVTQARCKAI